MKNTPFTAKSLRQQSALRRVKTPDVLVQQAQLHQVLLDRKGAAHRTLRKRDLLQLARVDDEMGKP